MNSACRAMQLAFTSTVFLLLLTGCETNPIKQNAQSAVSKAVNDGVKTAMSSASQFGASLMPNSAQPNQKSSQGIEYRQPQPDNTQKNFYPQTQQGLSQSCKGINIYLASLQRSGRGEITAQFFIENTNNQDRAIGVFYGGANGNNTFLIDSSGAEWPKKRMDGNGNLRQALISGVRTKYSLVFSINSGGNDVSNATVIIAPQVLPLTGVGTYGFCTLKFENVQILANTSSLNETSSKEIKTSFQSEKITNQEAREYIRDKLNNDPRAEQSKIGQKLEENKNPPPSRNESRHLDFSSLNSFFNKISPEVNRIMNNPELKKAEEQAAKERKTDSWRNSPFYKKCLYDEYGSRVSLTCDGD